MNGESEILYICYVFAKQKNVTAEWNRAVSTWLFRALEICLVERKSDAIEERNFSTRLTLVAWSRRYSLHLLCLLQNFAHLQVDLSLTISRNLDHWCGVCFMPCRLLERTMLYQTAERLAFNSIIPIKQISFHITLTEVSHLHSTAVFPSTYFLDIAYKNAWWKRQDAHK